MELLNAHLLVSLQIYIKTHFYITMKFFTLQCTYLFRRCFSCFLFQKNATKGAHLKISFQMRPFAFFFSFFLSDQSVMLHRLCHAVPLDGIGYVLCVRIQNLIMFSKRNGVCAAPEHGKVVAVAKYVCIFFLQLKLFLAHRFHSCCFTARAERFRIHRRGDP